MRNIILKKILIYGIVIMLIISFGPIITSGISYNSYIKKTEKITNHYEEELNDKNEYFNDKIIKKGNNDPENSFVCGFVTDIDTGLPIENVDVSLYWWDYEGNYDYNTTYTNSSGYYGMHTAAGYVDLYFYKDDYFTEYSWDNVIDDYEILFVNVTLLSEPPVTVSICGYIKDKITNDPITNAYIDLNWKDSYGHTWYNDTYSNASGFYQMGAPSGNIRIYSHPDGYYHGYSDWYIINENETFWINLSLEPIPPQTAVVCGYITDKMNGEPIEDAYVELYWKDEEGNYDYNDTHTDACGFYKMYTNPGRIRIYTDTPNYHYQYTEYYWIEDNQTIWINLSLIFEPEESIVACGYVLDSATHAPVKYAYVRYDWKDDIGHMYSKYTCTDKAGLFSIDIPPGSAQFYFTSYGYIDYTTSWIDINESENPTWINASISPEITVKIVRPLPGIYVYDILKTPIITKILSLLMIKLKPIIIGPITIEANVSQYTLGVNRVDFYIDDIFLKKDTIEPYNFTWNKTAYFNHRITVIAYDYAGTIDIDTVNIIKLS